MIKLNGANVEEMFNICLRKHLKMRRKSQKRVKKSRKVKKQKKKKSPRKRKSRRQRKFKVGGESKGGGESKCSTERSYHIKGKKYNIYSTFDDWVWSDTRPNKKHDKDTVTYIGDEKGDTKYWRDRTGTVKTLAELSKEGHDLGIVDENLSEFPKDDDIFHVFLLDQTRMPVYALFEPTEAGKEQGLEDITRNYQLVINERTGRVSYVAPDLKPPPNYEPAVGKDHGSGFSYWRDRNDPDAATATYLIGYFYPRNRKMEQAKGTFKLICKDSDKNLFKDRDLPSELIGELTKFLWT